MWNSNAVLRCEHHYKCEHQFSKVGLFSYAKRFNYTTLLILNKIYVDQIICKVS